jgi:hypothetical protein
VTREAVPEPCRAAARVTYGRAHTANTAASYNRGTVASNIGHQSVTWLYTLSPFTRPSGPPATHGGATQGDWGGRGFFRGAVPSWVHLPAATVCDVCNRTSDACGEDAYDTTMHGYDRSIAIRRRRRIRPAASAPSRGLGVKQAHDKKTNKHHTNIKLKYFICVFFRLIGEPNVDPKF